MSPIKTTANPVLLIDALTYGSAEVDLTDTIGLKLELSELDGSPTDIAEFLEAIKMSDFIPFDKVKINYFDKSWDFRKYTNTNVSKKRMKFNFNNCCETFQETLKDFVLISLLNNRVKIQSVHQLFSKLYLFFNIAEKRGYYDPKDITDDVITEFLHGYKDKAIRTYRECIWALREFYSFLATYYNFEITNARKEILTHDTYAALKNSIDTLKFADIPQDYFDNFVSACIKIMDESDAKAFIKCTAALMLIMSQTGLRIGECLGLTCDSLSTTTIFNGETAHYLTFKTWKREKGNNVSSEEFTYVNDLVKKAYDYLVNSEFSKEKRKQFNLDYLFMGGPKTKNYPLDSDAFDRFRIELYAYMDRYFPTVNVTLAPNVKGIHNRKAGKMGQRYNKDAQTLLVAHNHSFRVHVCTELYKAGVPLQYIEHYMTHLSSEMAAYYIDINEKNPQEDKEFSYDLMKKIVKGEAVPLGGKDVKGIKNKIEQIIEQNNFNVVEDLDAIVNEALKVIPIRPKLGGACIKSSIRDCWKDAKMNEIYCSYSVCPNVYDFFFNSYLSYKRFKKTIHAIEENTKNKFRIQADKEQKFLLTFSRKKVIPELEDLKRVISEQGAHEIMKKYPELIPMIENYDEIYKEVSEWIKQHEYLKSSKN